MNMLRYWSSVKGQWTINRKFLATDDCTFLVVSSFMGRKKTWHTVFFLLLFSPVALVPLNVCFPQPNACGFGWRYKPQCLELITPTTCFGCFVGRFARLSPFKGHFSSSRIIVYTCCCFAEPFHTLWVTWSILIASPTSSLFLLVEALWPFYYMTPNADWPWVLVFLSLKNLTDCFSLKFSQKVAIKDYQSFHDAVTLHFYHCHKGRYITHWINGLVLPSCFLYQVKYIVKKQFE